MKENFKGLPTPLDDFKYPEIVVMADNKDLKIVVTGDHKFSHGNLIEVQFCGLNYAYRSTSESYMNDFFGKIDSIENVLIQIEHSEWLSNISNDPAVSSFPEIKNGLVKHFVLTFSDEIFEILTTNTPIISKKNRTNIYEF